MTTSFVTIAHLTKAVSHLDELITKFSKNKTELEHEHNVSTYYLIEESDAILALETQIKKLCSQKEEAESLLLLLKEQ